MSDVELEGSRVRAAGGNPAALERGSGLEERIARSPWGAFAILTILYVIVVITQSHFKLLWLDELITLHIARQPSVGEKGGDMARAVHQRRTGMQVGGAVGECRSIQCRRAVCREQRFPVGGAIGRGGREQDQSNEHRSHKWSPQRQFTAFRALPPVCLSYHARVTFPIER